LGFFLPPPVKRKVVFEGKVTKITGREKPGGPRKRV